SFPYSPNAAEVDEQHVKVNEDFEHNDSGIQDAICIKNERDWHGQGRKPIAKGTIYKGCKQTRPGKNDHGRVKRRHLPLVQLPLSRNLARGEPNNSTTSPVLQSAAETAADLLDDWFDPIEAGLRDRVREFIQTMIESEL